MKAQAINTVQEAISFLRSIGHEVTRWGDSWIVYQFGPEGAEAAESCESDADLIAIARLEQNIRLCLARQAKAACGASSSSSEGSSRQAALPDWESLPNNNNQEVNA